MMHTCWELTNRSAHWIELHERVLKSAKAVECLGNSSYGKNCSVNSSIKRHRSGKTASLVLTRIYLVYYYKGRLLHLRKTECSSPVMSSWSRHLVLLIFSCLSLSLYIIFPSLVILFYVGIFTYSISLVP